jgi:cell division GTPase FtsZ
MLKCQVLGIGAGGNKATIELVNQGVINPQDVVLINSTMKDIPEEYREMAIELKGSNGCAKERKLAAKMVQDNIENGELQNLNDMLHPDNAFVIIVTSAEGGTGSGGSSALAKYISEDLGFRVHVCILCGFEDDARGLKNTIDLFRELNGDDRIIIDTISNKKFLRECNNNKRKAEKNANSEFANRVRILLGQKLVDCEDNIDDMDLLKVTTTPGYMDIVHGEFDKVKNVEEFNTEVKRIIDASKSYETEASCIRIAVIINRSEKIADNIGDAFDTIANVYGEAVEKFTHTQSVDGAPNYIDIIISGMKMPLDIMTEIYEDFKERLGKVDNSKDNFVDALSDLDTSLDAFDMEFSRTTKKTNFQNTKKLDNF